MNKEFMVVLFVTLIFSLTFWGSIGKAGMAETVDYTDAAHWLNLPTKIEKDVDVFYLYPTVWTRAQGESVYCNIDNPQMLVKAHIAFEYQATTFETIANIYAPFYRQADTAYCSTLPIEKQDEIVGGISADDAIAAFDYYIKNYNNGRPFILAGHSQGSYVMLFLMSRYLKDHPDVNKRMIASYIIGYSVTKQYLADNLHLKFATGADDTGVIISYNTEAPVVSGKNPILLPNALVINPINWKRDETPALATQNRGSWLPDKAGKPTKIEDLADATVNIKRGVVVCSTVDIKKYSESNPMFGTGVFHGCDYPFYYFNIRENAALRSEKFTAISK